MALTATAVTNAKPREKPYKLADERGLYLLVTKQGARKVEGRDLTISWDAEAKLARFRLYRPIIHSRMQFAA